LTTDRLKTIESGEEDTIMLTFGELAWAAYIYAIVTQGDKAYWKVEQERRFIDDFIRAPTSFRIKEVESVVVEQFLNRWGGCRISSEKTSRIASQIVKQLKILEAADLDSLSALSIRDVGAARLSGNSATRIKNLYDALSVPFMAAARLWSPRSSTYSSRSSS